MIKLYEFVGADEKSSVHFAGGFEWHWHIRASKLRAYHGILQNKKQSVFGPGEVSMLVDGKNIFSDSWEIAKFL